MSGRLCAWIALRVAAGIEFCWTHSTGSPDFAAHPAAGIEYPGASADAITTAFDGSPAALVANRSIAAANVAKSPPGTVVVFRPAGAPAAPTLMACAPSSGLEPVGSSWSIAAPVASGMLAPSVSRTGARIGGLES
jgi:hypothetical protein